MKKMVTKDEVLAAIAYWGTRQDPYNTPENLEIVISKMRDMIENEFKKDMPNFYYQEFQKSQIEDWLQQKLMDIEEFVDWNLSHIEKQNGIKVNDENRGSFLFTSASSHTPEEHDFIDLDACIRNIANMLMIEDL